MINKILIAVIILCTGLLIYNNYGDKEEIIKTEYVGVNAGDGQLRLLMMYCKSGNVYQVDEKEGEYAKYDSEGRRIEKGSFRNGQFYPEYSQTLVNRDLLACFIFILVLIVFIRWYYGKEFSPLQAFRDKYFKKELVAYPLLPEKEKALLLAKNNCSDCRDNPQLDFLEEKKDKQWDIVMLYFHCRKCDKEIKIRRK